VSLVQSPLLEEAAGQVNLLLHNRADQVVAAQTISHFTPQAEVVQLVKVQMVLMGLHQEPVVVEAVLI
jgi:hypothetical protein